MRRLRRAEIEYQGNIYLTLLDARTYFLGNWLSTLDSKKSPSAR